MEIEEWHPPGQAQMPDGPQAFPRTGLNSLASPLIRGVARTIDTLVVVIPYFAVAGIVRLVLDGGAVAAASSDTMQEPIEAAAWVALFAPLAVLVVAYETIGVALWGQTLGKFAVGIRVARQVNGRCPLWWEAMLRSGVVAVLFVIPDAIGVFLAMGLYASGAFDSMGRNVPDRAAGTVVVRSR